jgi:hypothetical protein
MPWNMSECFVQIHFWFSAQLAEKSFTTKAAANPNIIFPNIPEQFNMSKFTQQLKAHTA